MIEMIINDKNNCVSLVWGCNVWKWCEMEKSCGGGESCFWIGVDIGIYC